MVWVFIINSIQRKEEMWMRNEWKSI